MIIGLSGYPNSGKTTIKRYVTTNYEYIGATFAHNLKEMAQQCLLLSDVQIYDQKGKEEPFNFEVDSIGVLAIITWINTTHSIPAGNIVEINEIFNNLRLSEVTPRHILRILGTEICRELICDTYHIDVVKKNIEGCKNVIADDVRFDNEFDLCDCNILVKRRGMKFEEVHTSDKLLPEDQYCFVIEADDGDVDSLYKQIDVIVRSVKDIDNG